MVGPVLIEGYGGVGISALSRKFSQTPMITAEKFKKRQVFGTECISRSSAAGLNSKCTSVPVRQAELIPKVDDDDLHCSNDRRIMAPQDEADKVNK